MFNLSSPQDQVSNFIVNNAYSGQTLKYTFEFRIKSQYYGNKIKYKFYNPFTLDIFDLIKNAFQRLKLPTIHQ